MAEREPVHGADGRGCHYGTGGEGGGGGDAPVEPGLTVSNGGNGGKGFPGETLIVELEDLSVGARFEVEIGIGGQGGKAGRGYREGADGSVGVGGSVVFVPIFRG